MLFLSGRPERPVKPRARRKPRPAGSRMLGACSRVPACSRALPLARSDLFGHSACARRLAASVAVPQAPGNYASGVGAKGSRGSSGNGMDRERWGGGRGENLRVACSPHGTSGRSPCRCWSAAWPASRGPQATHRSSRLRPHGAVVFHKLRKSLNIDSEV